MAPEEQVKVLSPEKKGTSGLLSQGPDLREALQTPPVRRGGRGAVAPEGHTAREEALASREDSLP